MTLLATEKKDLSETVEILTTRCRLCEQERNKEALTKAAPEAMQKDTSKNFTNSRPEPPPPVASNSPLETLIQLEVLKAIKTFTPSAVPSTVPPAAPSVAPAAFQSVPPPPHDSLEKHLKIIHDKLECIIDNEKFLFERFLSLENTVNELYRAQSDVPPRFPTVSPTKITAESSSQTSPVNSLLSQPPNASPTNSSASSSAASASVPPPQSYPPSTSSRFSNKTSCFSAPILSPSKAREARSSGPVATPPPPPGSGTVPRSILQPRKSLLGPPPLIRNPPPSIFNYNAKSSIKYPKQQQIASSNPPNQSRKSFTTKIYTNRATSFSNCPNQKLLYLRHSCCE